MQSEAVFGIISADGIRLLDEDPFVEGAQIPLRAGESLYMYRNREELAAATRSLSNIDKKHPSAYWPVWFLGGITGATVASVFAIIC